jgi:hypothetical protein
MSEYPVPPGFGPVLANSGGVPGSRRSTDCGVRSESRIAVRE